jgi:hypothetical protein
MKLHNVCFAVLRPTQTLTDENDGLVRQTRRKSSQYRMLSRGFATRHGGQRYDFMSMFCWSAVLVLASLLAACGGGPVRKIHPSTASIQQLSVQPDGTWRITLRIQNYSTFSMHYSALDAQLNVAGSDAGALRVAPDIDIVGNNGDVIETMFKTSVKLPTSGDFAYQLKGTITTSEPQESFKFDVSSRLSPVPGVPNTWR